MSDDAVIADLKERVTCLEQAVVAMAAKVGPARMTAASREALDEVRMHEIRNAQRGRR